MKLFHYNSINIFKLNVHFYYFSNQIANFTLPSPDFGWFDDVIYTELDEEEAKKKVEEFNEKGKKVLKERERDTDRRDRRKGLWSLRYIFISIQNYRVKC